MKIVQYSIVFFLGKSKFTERAINSFCGQFIKKQS